MGRFIVVIDHSNEDEVSPSILVPTAMNQEELTQSITQAVDEYTKNFILLRSEADKFYQENLKHFNFNKETEDYSEAELTLLEALVEKRKACSALECFIEIENKKIDLTALADLVYGQIYKGFKVMTPDEWFDDTVLKFSDTQIN